MNKTALLLGATGLTGQQVLALLLEDSSYSKIKIFGRSSVQNTHPKIEEHLGDLFDLASFSKDFIGDVVFCCIGTTKAKTPNKILYKKIDYGIPLAAAKLSKTNGIATFMVISSLGADAKSSTFYTKVKGEMERDVLAVEIQNTYLLQPSLLGGKRTEKRIGERIALGIMGTLEVIIPKKYQIIEPKTIAKGMLVLHKTQPKLHRIPSDEIKKIAQHG